MIKRIFLMILALITVSCSSSKPVARNHTYRKPSTTVARKVRKPVAANKQQTTSNSAIRREYEQARESDKSTASETVYSKSEILEATSRVKVTTAMVYDYIDQFKDIAKNNMLRYGIPASITLGQGILESGAGTAPLSALANNHFGIKCHKEWTGPSVSYDDDAEQECFRKYSEAAESYQDHSLFLTSRSRYADLFTLEKDDYKAWAKGLKRAGYATDSRYPEKLIGIIERYQLYKYDSEVLGRDYIPVNVPQEKALVSADGEMYQVTKGDTLYSISKRFNLSVDELRRKNNISDNAISIGQNLKVK